MSSLSQVFLQTNFILIFSFLVFSLVRKLKLGIQTKYLRTTAQLLICVSLLDLLLKNRAT